MPLNDLRPQPLPIPHHENLLDRQDIQELAARMARAAQRVDFLLRSPREGGARGKGYERGVGCGRGIRGGGRGLRGVCGVEGA